MWLFVGRYAHYAPAICAIAVAAVATACMFLARAARLVRRSDLLAVIVVAVSAAWFGYMSGFAEPVFVGNGSLNRGAALLLAIFGGVLGVGGAILPAELRMTRILLLFAAAGLIFGDVAGWIQRSAGPSKYDHPVGKGSPSRMRFAEGSSERNS